MSKTILDEATINSYIHYAKALMLHRAVAVRRSDYQGILKDTRPKFTGELGGKMCIKINQGEDCATLSSVEDGSSKEISLPLEAQDAHAYLCKLGILNTPKQIGNPMTNPAEWQVKRFYEYPKAERPESFSVDDDYDRVLKHITDYVETTKGGAVSIAEARKIVFQAMFKIGVLPENSDELFNALKFGDYHKDIAALTCPKDTGGSNVSEKTNEHSGSSKGGMLPIPVFLLVVVLGINIGLLYFLSH